MKDCREIDALLMDGSPEAMAEAERHAVSCEACEASLASWREISDTAASMQMEWESDLLWPRIERSLAAERRRRPLTRAWRAAAAVLLFALMGGTMIYALRAQNAHASFDRDILRVSALDDVDRAQQAHVEAIERLEHHAEKRLDEAETPLMVSYKEKLMLLDDAIAECETNIERNRQNAYLRKQLLAMYSEKQTTLQDVLREDTDEATR